MPATIEVNPLQASVDTAVTLASEIIAGFRTISGAQDEPGETVLTDLLANLMHWCDRYNQGFDHCLRGAYRHYYAELRGEL